MLSRLWRVILMFVFVTISSVCLAGEANDKREKIFLNEEERAHVLAEMRMFLTSVQQITRGVSEEDMKRVIEYAKKSGRAGGGGAPSTLGKKLPKKFRILGLQTHSKFDQLAMDAADLEDPGHALSQLSSLMKNCLSCHASYQIELIKK